MEQERPTVPVTVELDPETTDRLEAIAARDGVSRDAVVSEHLAAWLRRQ